MDLTYENAPLALKVMEQQIEGTPSVPGMPENLGQRGMVMALQLQVDAIEHSIKEAGAVPSEDRAWLEMSRQLRGAEAALNWMIARRQKLEAALLSAESGRDRAIKKAMEK